MTDSPSTSNCPPGRGSDLHLSPRGQIRQRTGPNADDSKHINPMIEEINRRREMDGLAALPRNGRITPQVAENYRYYSQRQDPNQPEGRPSVRDLGREFVEKGATGDKNFRGGLLDNTRPPAVSTLPRSNGCAADEFAPGGRGGQFPNMPRYRDAFRRGAEGHGVVPPERPDSIRIEPKYLPDGRPNPAALLPRGAAIAPVPPQAGCPPNEQGGGAIDPHRIIPNPQAGTYSVLPDQRACVAPKMAL